MKKVQKNPHNYCRFIDPDIGVLAAEGAHQEIRSVQAHPGFPPPKVWAQVPSRSLDRDDPHYYNRPFLKEPVWIWSVPLYLYVGGVAGASAALAATAQLRRKELSGLITRCRLIAAAGASAGASLLTYDLGKPLRFTHMMRVFRPSSPMNVGSWIIASSTSLSGASFLSSVKERWRKSGDTAGIAAGLIGILLAGYTGVLLANTAVPVWQESRRALPILFIGSAMASLGSLLEMVPAPVAEERVSDIFGRIGKAVELAAIHAVELETGRIQRVRKPLHSGLAGVLWQGAKLMSAASLLVSILPGQGRKKRAAAGILGTVGAIVLRFGLVEAGKASARDSRAAFHQQQADMTTTAGAIQMPAGVV